MTDNEPKETEESVAGGGSEQAPPVEKEPERTYNIREEVNRALEDVFSDIETAEDDLDVVDDAPPPAMTNREVTVSEAGSGQIYYSVEEILADSDPDESVENTRDDDGEETQSPGEAQETEPVEKVKPPVAGQAHPATTPSPPSEAPSKQPLNVSLPPAGPPGSAGDERKDQPTGADTPARASGLTGNNLAQAQPLPSPAEVKPRKPFTVRILVWGAVLIIIAGTVRYFATYSSEELATGTVGKTGELFYKVTPLPPLATGIAPAVQTTPKPAAVTKPQAAPLVKVPTPAAKPTAQVKAYVPGEFPYAIHMSSFRSSEAAQEKVALHRRGFQAYLVRVDLGKKGIWYRLFFGHFPNATTAMDAIQKYHLTGALVSRTRYACLMGSYPSVAQADTATQALSGKGFFPYTIARGGDFHLFVGAHPTMGGAEAISKELSDRGFSFKLINR